MRGLNGRNGQLLKAVDTTRVSLEKKPQQHSCKASECCLVTDIRASPVGKQEWIEITKNRSTERADGRYFFFFLPNRKAIIYPIIRNKWWVMSSYSILVKWSAFGLRGFQRQIYCPRWGESSTKSTPWKNVFVYDLIHYDFYYTAEWEVIIVEILERWNVTKCCLNIIDKTWIAFQERKVVTLEIL